MDWYSGTPPKNGQYLCTVQFDKDRPGVWKTRAVSYSFAAGWCKQKNMHVICWTLMPPPWDTMFMCKNPFEGEQNPYLDNVKKKVDRMDRREKKRKETEDAIEKARRDYYENIYKEMERNGTDNTGEDEYTESLVREYRRGLSNIGYSRSSESIS